MDKHEALSNSGMRIAVTGTLAILALFLFVEAVSVAENLGRPSNPATDTITVSGTGSAHVAPDVAHITFTVQNDATTVADAQAATTKQANAAIAYAKEQKIADKDIKTLSYNIYPQYSYPEPCVAGSLCPTRTPKITGYQVSETVQLTVRDLDATGTILGGLGSLGVQNVSGPSLSLDDPTAGYTAARADAIAQAKTQAETLANQLGVRLGRIVNFSESNGGYSYPVAYGMGATSKDSVEATPSIPTGENEYSANVSITYEIR